MKNLYEGIKQIEKYGLVEDNPPYKFTIHFVELPNVVISSNTGKVNSSDMDREWVNTAVIVGNLDDYSLRYLLEAHGLKEGCHVYLHLQDDKEWPIVKPWGLRNAEYPHAVRCAIIYLGERN